MIGKPEVLADSLVRVGMAQPHGSILTRCALGIMANPQTHIDALVDAGVLSPCGRSTEAVGMTVTEPIYRVVQPHVHEWRVGTTGVEARQPVVELWCDGCREHRKAANRLPIEVPE